MISFKELLNLVDDQIAGIQSVDLQQMARHRRQHPVFSSIVRRRLDRLAFCIIVDACLRPSPHQVQHQVGEYLRTQKLESDFRAELVLCYFRLVVQR
jgi:hypothetical protein